MKRIVYNTKWVALLLSIFGVLGISSASAEVLSHSVFIRSTQEAKEQKNLPKDCSAISYNNTKYYESKGRYFIEIEEGYQAINPPAGITTSELERGYTSFTLLNRNFYSYKGVIYQDSPSGGYIVASPEVGMSIPSLPEGEVREVLIDGELHFEAGGFVYKPIMDGEQYIIICTFESLMA